MVPKILISTDNAATVRVLRVFANEPDDSLALAVLLSAHRNKKFKIIGITSTFGNTDGETSYHISKNQVKLSKSDIPVIKGATYSGQTNSPAVQFISNNLKQSKKKLILVALGPVTDYAAVFKKHPNLTEKVEKFLLVRSGPYLIKQYWYLFSFNAIKDIKAAKFMYQLGANQFSMGDEIFKICFNDKKIKELKRINNSMISFIAKDLIRWNLQNKFFPNKGYFSRKGNMCPWDLVWSMYLVEPDLYRIIKKTDHLQLEVRNRETFLKKTMDLLKEWESK